MKKISTLAIITLLIVSIGVSSCKKTHSSTKSINSDSVTKLSQFLILTVNDSIYSYGGNLGDSLEYDNYDTSVYVWAWHQYYDSTLEIGFKTPTIAVGSNEVFYYFTLGGNITANNIDGSPVSPIYVHITEYGAIGQYVSGNFSGTIFDAHNSKNYTLSGSFRIKRTTS